MKKSKFILIILILSFGQLPVIASNVKFTHISDLHYQSNVLRKNINYYALPIIDSVADDINADGKIEFTLITGDVINKRKYNDAKFIYSHFNEIFKKPWYLVFGNHDVGGKVVFKLRLINLLKQINEFFKNINKDYYVFKPKEDMLFIGINSNYSFFRTPVGYISKKQLKLIDETIQDAGKGDVIVIFMHHTLLDFPLLHNNHYIKNAQELKEVLNKYSNPILVLGGHYHACKIARDGNIINVETPSLSTLPLAYRVINIENNEDKAMFNFIYKQVDCALVRYILSKVNVDVVQASEGSEDDKNIRIEILK